VQAGVDFEKHEKEGIDVELFGALMMVSGLTLTPEVRRRSFNTPNTEYSNYSFFRSPIHLFSFSYPQVYGVNFRSVQVRWVSFHSYFDFGYLVKVRIHAHLKVSAWKASNASCDEIGEQACACWQEV
jgi:hypothetical protein